MSKQYNLRSTKPDSIQLPVQVQLCDDGEFMTRLLSTGSETLHDKQMGHDSSSESELDCSAIVGASDSDDSKMTLKSPGVGPLIDCILKNLLLLPVLRIRQLKL